MDTFQTHSGISRLILIGILAAGLLLGGCSDSGGGGGGTSSSSSSNSSSSSSGSTADTTPDTFQFTPKGDVDAGQPVESNTITVTGIDAPADISIDKGAYRIGDGGYTSDAGQVEADQTVTVRLTAPTTPEESDLLTLTIGGVEADFEITTIATANGLFTGTGEVDGSTALTDVKGMVYENRFILFDTAQHVLYDGQITDISGNTVVGETDVYKDGVLTGDNTDIPTTGTVMSYATLALTFDGEGDVGFDDGTVDLTFDGNAYNTEATNERLRGTGSLPVKWGGSVYMALSGAETTDLEFESSNEYSYQSLITDPELKACNHLGDVSINTEGVNIYKLEEAVSEGQECPISLTSDYRGLSTVLDVPTEASTLWYAVTNGTHSIFGIFDEEE